MQEVNFFSLNQNDRATGWELLGRVFGDTALYKATH